MPKNYIQIPVILTEKNFKDFLTFDTMTKQRRWKKPIRLAICLFVFATMCYTFQENYPFLGVLGNILVVLTVFFPTNYFRSFNASVKEQASKMNLGSSRLVYTIHLTTGSKGIQYFYPNEETAAGTYSWKSIDSAWRTKDAIYLYVTSEQALLIPLNGNSQKHEEIWELTKKNLAETKIHIIKH